MKGQSLRVGGQAMARGVLFCSMRTPKSQDTKDN